MFEDNAEDTVGGGTTLSDTEKFEDQHEKIPYERPQAEADTLAKAVAAFEEDRHNASFSKRNPDLGKMISCSLCDMRHRVHDLMMLNSTAHGEQVFGDMKYPSRTAAFAKKRLHPHPNKKQLVFVQRVRALLPYYGVEKLEIVKGIVKARLEREREAAQVPVRNRQKRSRQINWGSVCF
jgi:hypothetical protein